MKKIRVKGFDRDIPRPASPSGTTWYRGRLEGGDPPAGTMESGTTDFAKNLSMATREDFST